MTLNPLMTRERVVIPPRKAPTKAEKVEAWNRVNGICELCGKPVPPSGADVEYDHTEAYRKLRTDQGRLDYLARLPWIGGITKYHLAKNFGVNVAKPDVHLQRLADHAGEGVQAMCERLAAETGFRAATVDLILWRACATGLLNSRDPLGRASLATLSESDPK